MADKKISQLTGATTPLAGTEVLPIVQSGSTVKVSAADITAGRAVSASSVAVTGSAVPANGIYLPATNTLGVATNGTGKAQINSNGQVGIGLTPYTSVGGNGDLLQIGDPLTKVGAGLTIGATTTGDIQFSDAASGTGQYAGLIRYSHSTNALSIWTDSASRLTVSSTGNLAFNATKGIDFSANTGAAGMTSELLDWYEEGNWNPTLSCGTSGTITLTSGDGTYTRVGNQVTVTCFIDVASVASPVGILFVDGLPFTSGSAAKNRSAAAVYANGLETTATTSIVGRIVPSESRIRLEKFAAGVTSAMAGDVKAGSAFQISLTYLV